jgi:hypothetical protein
MPKAGRTLLILLILLLPSAYNAWRDRTMPDLGYLHDDGVLFVSAKSIATSNGYRIPSLPEQPAQTKFPPLYPLYLSLVWWVNPDFPENLRLATLLSWLALGGTLVLAWRLYRRTGFSEPRTWVLVGLLAVNPYMILFGTRMFSEVFFTAWVLATLLVISRGGIRMAVLAGLLAGCAYLSRTAGIVLLISVPAVLIWKREWRRGIAFAATMLPAVIAWSVWTRANMAATPDPTLLYYTDYVRYQFLNVGLDNLGVVLWKNLDQVLYAIGSLAMPKVVDLLPVKILTQVIGIAMIAGTVRLVRRGVLIHYAAFGLVSTGMLLMWHFPPNERFVLPLFPLLAAGLVEELEHLAKMLWAGFRHREVGQRVVAGIIAIAAVAIFGTAAAMQGYVTLVFLHQSAQEKSAKLHDLKEAYSWISTNLPASATMLAYDDPLLYLYTGWRGNYLPLLPRWWYAEDHAAMIGAYRDLANYCRNRGLDYVLFTSQDLSREVGEEDRQAIERVVRENPRLKPVYQGGIVTVYKMED